MKKPWHFRYDPTMVLFGRARALNALSSTPRFESGLSASPAEMGRAGCAG